MSSATAIRSAAPAPTAAPQRQPATTAAAAQAAASSAAHHDAAASTAAAAAAPPPPAPAAAAAVPAVRPMLPYGCRSVTRFEKLNLIGEGTYGTVYRARDRASGDIVALKKIRPMKGGSGGGFPLTSIREVSLLQAVSHPNIIRLREIAVGRKVDNIFLVFDYCAHDLASLVERLSRPFAEAEVKQIMCQLLEATAYLHANFIVHRDLKLSNLLVDAQGRLKLADFGLARLFSNPLEAMTPRVVTLWYRSPELLLSSDKYHSAVDVWSCGAIFGELLRHRPLLPGKNELHQLSLICALLGTPNEKIWPGFTALHARSGGGPDAPPFSLPVHPYNNLSHEFPSLGEQGLDLLSRMLTLDPAKRITAEKARAHPYFFTDPLPCPPHLMPTFAAAHSQQPNALQQQQLNAAAAAAAAVTAASSAPMTSLNNAAAAAATLASRKRRNDVADDTLAGDATTPAAAPAADPKRSRR